MSCIIAFQLSRNVPLQYWYIDKHIEEIISNGRVISNANRYIPLCVFIRQSFTETIRGLNDRASSLMRFLDKNNKSNTDINSVYFVYDLSFDIEEVTEIPIL